MIKIFAVAAISMAMFSSCGNGGKGNEASGTKDSTSSDKELLGAGSTFVYPLCSKLFDAYNQSTGVKVNYQSIGSGGGIKQLQAKTVDFGASDAFMSDDDIKAAGADIIEFPVCMGAVVITYNVPGVAKLKITPEILSGIFMGTIKNWNDKEIAKANGGVKLPNTEIIVVHRSDGSGTTNIFTDYLSKVSADWKTKVGVGKSVNWPVGVGGKGNEGVAGQVKQTPGAIGYVELIYAAKNNMVFADMKNASGNFITPSLQSVQSAANIDLPADTRITITNSPAADAYPISGFTWFILYKEQNYGGRSMDKAGNLTKMMWWVTHEGQQYNEPLQYAKLSDKATKVVETLLNSVTYGGKPILNNK